jgi:hypothetical protein
MKDQLTETISATITKDELKRIEELRKRYEKIPTRSEIVRELVLLGLKIKEEEKK